MSLDPGTPAGRRLRRTAIRALASGALVTAGALSLSGCDGPGALPAASEDDAWFGSVRPPAGQVFRYNNGPEPEHLDPGLMSGQPDGRIARSIFEGLVVSHSRTLEPEPGQAYRWSVSDDGLLYRFHLRPGLVWTNGDPVTAHDFEWSWLRVLDPDTGSRYAGLLYPIRNAEAFNRSELDDASEVGVAAVDDSTFEVRLQHPTPYFLFSLTFYSFLPVHRASVERWGDRWTRPEHLVGNGPFRIRSWRQGAQFELERNETYWDAERVRLDRIVAYSVEELNTSVNLYKAGTIDWNPSGYTPAEFLPYVQHYRDFEAAPYQGVYFYSLNTTEPPLDDVWVRRALTYSIDRETISNKLLKGTRIPWGNMTPTGYIGYEHPEGVRYDPEYARACLARAGYPGGEGFPRVDILFNTSEDHRRIAEAIQAMWKRDLDIEVTLSNQEWASYLNATTNLRYQIARRSWIGDYLDPTTFLNCFLGGDGNNRTGWSNAEYDRLLRLSAEESDPGKRMEMLARAEAILLDEAPVLPIYHYVSTTLLKPYVRGLHPTALDFHPMKGVWIDHGESGPPAVAEARPPDRRASPEESRP